MSSPTPAVLADQPLAGRVCWWTYIVECADRTLYTGVATDLQRRIEEHNGHRSGGARYTRSRRPVTLVYLEPCDDRSAACRRESEIKRMSRQRKQSLIKQGVVRLRSTSRELISTGGVER